MLNRIKSLLGNSNEVKEEDEAQQIAIAAGVLLIEIARADDDIADDEINIAINHLKYSFQNSALKIDDVFKETIKEKSDDATSLYEFTDLINKEWDKEKKLRLLQALWEVANADNRIDKYEEYYIRKIKDLIYLSDQDFITAKLKVLDDK
ncbi:MAG: TerB family tellurite resistance protein [Pseudomonadota bacterium]|nr:TerB family tellurite resistance protein [Pseudomonadota bacterium]